MIYAVERRQSRLGSLTPEQIRAMLSRPLPGAPLVLQPGATATDPYATQTDYLPLAAAGLAAFALGAAGIVILLKKRGK